MNRIPRIGILYGYVIMKRHFAHIFIFVAVMEPLVKADGKLLLSIEGKLIKRPIKLFRIV